MYGRPCCGGNPYVFAKFYNSNPFIKKINPAKAIDPIPWSNNNAYYHKDQGAELCASAVPADSISTIPYYSIEHCEAQVIPTTDIGKEAAIANIKDILRQKKAVIFTFMEVPGNTLSEFWGTESENAVWHFDNWNCGGKECHEGLGGHAVLCVGYDDRDPQNRYWIMVNSWPTNPNNIKNDETRRKYPSINRPNNIFLVSMDMDYDSKYFAPLGTEIRDGTVEMEDYFFKWWTLDITWAGGDGVGFFQSGNFKLDKDLNGGIDQIIKYANNDDKPIVGDWDNDGIDGIGYFRPSDHTFHLDDNLDGNDDKVISYGKSTDLPLSVKWRKRSGIFSSPREGIGYFRPSDHTFHLDINLDGQDDFTPISYGESDSIPLAGDWDGDGFDGIGYYDYSDKEIHLDNNHDGKDDETFGIIVGIDRLRDSPSAGEQRKPTEPKKSTGLPRMGGLGSLNRGSAIPFDYPLEPIVGDWNADGKDEIGAVLLEHRWKKITSSQFYNRIDYLCFYLSAGRFVYYKPTPNNAECHPISGNWN